MGMCSYLIPTQQSGPVSFPTLRALAEEAWKTTTPLAYWRKHHDLHGYMEALDAEKRGSRIATEDSGEFAVEVTLEDLLTLRKTEFSSDFDSPAYEHSNTAHADSLYTVLHGLLSTGTRVFFLSLY
jgi:hypothetical protein